jgi:hypothetical protein
MNKLAFIGRFLLVFALLITVGWLTNAPSRYARSLQTVASFAGPVTSGWWLEERVNRGVTQIWFRQGEQELRLLLSLEALSLGLLPLLSLLGATPGLGVRRLFFCVLIGSVGVFALDLLVLLLYPFLVLHPNAFTDITGTFLGLLTFVGAPVILWFGLTFTQLRPVWGFGIGETSTQAPPADRRPSRRR